MEAVVRKPFEGVMNIVRFNWHFYVIAAVVMFALPAVSLLINPIAFRMSLIVVTGIILTTIVSLAVSYYVYDRSGLYNFSWINSICHQKPDSVANIHAGFDESSAILRWHFPHADFHVFDFYNPAKHTEVSIERARKAYAAFPNTVKIETSAIPVEKGRLDLVFNIFALHEIRDRAERISFLKQQCALLTKEGTCIVVEHLRDAPNFIAYNIGFFHFLSPREWKSNFSAAGLELERTFKITPFVSVFILRPAHGDTR